MVINQDGEYGVAKGWEKNVNKFWVRDVAGENIQKIPTKQPCIMMNKHFIIWNKI